MNLLLPLLAVGTTLLIGFLRPDDDHAFLAGLLFLCFSALFGTYFWSLPPVVRELAVVMHSALTVLFSYTFMRFFLVFPSPGPVDRRAPWLKHVLLVPVLCLAALSITISLVAGHSLVAAERLASRLMIPGVEPVFSSLYIGMLLLGMGSGVSVADEWSQAMVGVLTAGIAISMVVLGFVPDKWGVRRALIWSFVFLVVGRVVMSAAPTVLGLQPNGLWSSLHLVTMGGIVLVVIGYGMYQPAAYSAVRQFTTPKTASMAYAMLYALMNAGSSLAMLGFLLRDEEFLGLGITGTFWIYTALTVVSLASTVLILSRKTVDSLMG